MVRKGTTTLYYALALVAAIIGRAAPPTTTPAECVRGQAGEMRMVTVTELPRHSCASIVLCP
jgi:hypothetical protein